MVGLPYWVPFIIAAFCTLVTKTPSPRDRIWVVLLGTGLALFVGLRHEVGGDWGTYVRLMEAALGVPLSEGLVQSEPGYALLNWIGANVFGGIYFVNIICATVAVSGLVYFCNRQADPVLALLVAIPYLVTIVYMGYTRQSVAIGLAFLAILAALDRKLTWFIFWVVVASLFHKTALFLLIFLPAFGRPILNFKFWLVAIVLLGDAYILFFDKVDQLVQAYFLGVPQSVASGRVSPENGDPSDVLQSGGAIVRLLMGLGSALIFGYLVVRQKVSDEEKRIWGIAALTVVVLFVMSFFLSTFADRLGFYLFALQIFALSALPSLFAGWTNFAIRLGIVGVYGLSLFIWLNFSAHAVNWLPYQSVLGTLF